MAPFGSTGTRAATIACSGVFSFGPAGILLGLRSRIGFPGHIRTGQPERPAIFDAIPLTETRKIIKGRLVRRLSRAMS